MIEDIDIYRTANLMIKQYGEKALHEAIKRSSEFMISNADAAHTWRRIADAIEWTLAPSSQDYKSMH